MFGAVDVVMSVDRTKITMNDQVELKIDVRGGQGSSDPQIPVGGAFTIMGGATSSQMKFVNGKVSVNKSYQYSLLPKKVGHFFVGPAKVTVGSTVYKSNPVQITVKKALPRNSKASNQEKQYYVEAVVDKKHPYLGEDFLYTFRLYTRVRFMNTQAEFPDFIGFLKENVEKEKNYTKVLDGQRWQVIEVKYLLSPKESGVKTIGPSVLHTDVVIRSKKPRRVRQRRSVFDHFLDDPFFGGRREVKKVHLRTKPIEIKIKELPEENRPKSFSGLIGRDLKLSMTIDKDQFRQGESATLSLTLSGKGNISDYLWRSAIESEYKVYKDKPVIEKKIISNSLVTTKKFKWAIVPQEMGEIIIPPMEIIYFNTKSETYETLSSSEIKLNILAPEKGDETLKMTQGDSGVITVKKRVKVLGQDLMPIKYSYSKAPSDLSIVLYILGLFLLPLLNFLIWIGFKRREFGVQNKDLIRSRKALASFRTDLKKVNVSSSDFVEKFSKVVRNYLGDRVGLDGLALTSHDLERHFQGKLEQSTLQELLSVFEKFEMASYGGGDIPLDQKKMLMDRASELMSKMEKELK